MWDNSVPRVEVGLLVRGLNQNQTISLSLTDDSLSLTDERPTLPTPTTTSTMTSTPPPTTIGARFEFDLWLIELCLGSICAI